MGREAQGKFRKLFFALLQRRFQCGAVLVNARLMSASPPLGLTDEEVERLLNGDNEPQQHVQEPATVADAIDTAFQALSQVTGASQQNPNADGSQPTGDAVRAIWGSSLEVSHVMTRVFSFARSFRKDGDSAQSEAYYIRIIGQVRVNCSPQTP